jgi:hypothetical protein
MFDPKVRLVVMVALFVAAVLGKHGIGDPHINH